MYETIRTQDEGSHESIVQAGERIAHALAKDCEVTVLKAIARDLSERTTQFLESVVSEDNEALHYQAKRAFQMEMAHAVLEVLRRQRS